ncbi:hypothetical protein C1646_760863 [Rhizophagus diaphanus]|nr:hypothetical protein C1646_760863 [Rhizophagus diaphanus] [Rhizophagus sp. MUCL 43196]
MEIELFYILPCKKLKNLVIFTDDNNKLENKINQTKKDLKQQIDKLVQQMECIIKYIGVEKDNKEKQDNKLEKQMEQTKEELQTTYWTMDKHMLQMDKLNQQMEIFYNYY